MKCRLDTCRGVLKILLEAKTSIGFVHEAPQVYTQQASVVELLSKIHLKVWKADLCMLESLGVRVLGLRRVRVLVEAVQESTGISHRHLSTIGGG